MRQPTALSASDSPDGRKSCPPCLAQDGTGSPYGVRVVKPEEVGLLQECYALRHWYFVQQRKWVPESPDRLGYECDAYDAHAIHLLVEGEEGIAAYLRVLPYEPAVGFMLERDFRPLLTKELQADFGRENAVELSRLVCRGGSIPNGTSPHPLELLLRQLYWLSTERGFDRYYAVVEENWLRPFERRFGLPFQPLGAPYVFPDGTRTVAVQATLSELEGAVRSKDRRKYEWYTRSPLDKLPPDPCNRKD